MNNLRMRAGSGNCMAGDVVTLKKKLKALIVFRVIFVTLFFGSSFLVWGLPRFSYIHSLTYLIIVLYVVTIVYALLLERVRNLFLFGYA